MSAASDKARFFLEQSVPELKEFERKKIFSPDEISSIAKKRSDFEHRINARGSKPGDYARYAEFEINVDTLRRMRVKRMGIKSTTHSGQRRIFFVFDRGTRKFPGDLDLWLQSLEYAKRQKAFKKLTQMLTNVLRLHPTKADLWIYAADFALEEHADMTEARSYMQRGLRFCKRSRRLWLEYCKLEMTYIAKIHARRKVLGLAEDRDEELEVPHDTDVNEAAKPMARDISAAIAAENDHDSETVVANSKLTTVSAGAIPLAIFEAAMIQFDDDPDVAHSFFDVFAQFPNVPSTAYLLRQVGSRLETRAALSWHTRACQIHRPVIGVSTSSPEFLAAFRQSLALLRSAEIQPPTQAQFNAWARQWLETLVADEDVDPAIKTIVVSQVTALGNSGLQD